MSTEKGRVENINMLLDINKFSGESSGRLAPVMWFFGLSGAPLLIFLYLFTGIIPIKYFLIAYIPYVIRIAMITIGDEKSRVAQYKRQLYDIYNSIYDEMEIQTIHKDGMIEYVNGTVCYFLVGYNAENLDALKRAQIIKRINAEIGRYYDFDIRGYNTNIADDLYRRYEGVKLFGDEDVARDFLAIIDYNRSLVEKKTLMSITVYCVYARLSEYQDVKNMLISITERPEAKAFRELKIADKETVKLILSEDIDTYVSLEEMQRERYSTGQYFGSHVVAFDERNETFIKTDEEDNEKGFLMTYE